LILLVIQYVGRDATEIFIVPNTNVLVQKIGVVEVDEIKRVNLI